jgi:hypothetical protein
MERMRGDNDYRERHVEDEKAPLVQDAELISPTKAKEKIANYIKDASPLRLQVVDDVIDISSKIALQDTHMTDILAYDNEVMQPALDEIGGKRKNKAYDDEYGQFQKVAEDFRKACETGHRLVDDRDHFDQRRRFARGLLTIKSQEMRRRRQQPQPPTEK